MSLPRIAVDAMGGDEGVRVMVAGAALRAPRVTSRFKFLLVGDETQIRQALENHPNMRGASEILHAEGVVDGARKADPGAAPRQDHVDGPRDRRGEEGRCRRRGQRAATPAR